MLPEFCQYSMLKFLMQTTDIQSKKLTGTHVVLQVNFMLKQLSEQDFGPGIDFREYSFLDNPLLPKMVLSYFDT